MLCITGAVGSSNVSDPNEILVVNALYYGIAKETFISGCKWWTTDSTLIEMTRTVNIQNNTNWEINFSIFFSVKTNLVLVITDHLLDLP